MKAGRGEAGAELLGEVEGGGAVAFIFTEHQQRIAVARSTAKVEASVECSHFTIHPCGSGFDCGFV